MSLHGEKLDQEKKDPAQKVFQVSRKLIEEISQALARHDPEQLDDLLSPLHSADIADILEQLSQYERRLLTSHMGSDIDPAVLPQLDDATLDHVIGELDDQHVVDVITRLESNDAVHVLEDMDEADRHRIIDALPEGERLAVQQGLAFPEDSAGRLLQRNLIAVPGAWNVGQVIDFLRDEQDLPDEFYEIFIVDPLHHPIGTVSLSHFLRRKRDVQISSFMNKDPKVVSAELDQEEVAYLFRQYDLTSMGVVDTDGRLLGMIMVDDVVDVMEEEAEEDILRMAGVQETDIAENVFEASKNRIIWLLINLATAILASMVIALFDASLEKMVALAILMPIVASMGGNAGTQTMTVAVRALANRDLTSSNAFRVVVRELSIGVVNGIVLAVVVGVAVALWFDNSALGGVMGAAMLVNMIVAGLAGILVPLILEKMNIDPALASSVFVTTITDVVGFLSFLGLAALLLL